ncbi:MAG: response regulator [Nitrospirae bacterium]|nr:response regulator [Nitrospirota bacterium]
MKTVSPIRKIAAGLMFRDMTIRKKLTLMIMGASAVAVMLASIVFYIMMVTHFRSSYEKSLSGLAEVLASNCQASLAFRLPEEADHLISSLSARPSVVYAVISDMKGNRFASYGKPPDAIKSGGFVSGYMMVREDISLGNNVIGTLTVYDNMSSINRMRLFAVLAAFLAVSLSMIAALVLAAPMQKLISGPILALASATDRISREQDFSFRTPKQGNDEVGQLVDAFNAMISQIAKRNEELTESENRFHALLDQAVDAFYLFDTAGVIIDVNQKACTDLGYTRDELLCGMTISDIDAGMEGELADRLPWHGLQPLMSLTVETRHRRNNGLDFPVEMSFGIIEFSGYRFVMGLARDISERRQSEQEKQKLEAQLLQAQKMEAIGHLAGGIAHDFNNMLQAIIGYASLLDMRMEKNSPLKSYVAEILNSSEKSSDLTKQLLAFSRKQVISPKQIELNQLITGMEKLLRRLIGEDIDFITNLADRDLMVVVDPSQIGQVLMNLCTNARDAMPDGGHLSIGTETVQLGGDYIAANIIETPGLYALVSVTDTGEGMDEETRQKIFDPFFTTKEVGKGTGLGLSMAYGIIKQHNGHISVYSELGKGTTFRIYLPLCGTKHEEAETASATLPKGGKETILVAEDNEEVRGLIRNVLEGFGYTVILAVDGEDAIHKFTENQDIIQLVMLDVIMPKRNGKEVCDVIKKNRPDMDVLFSSGYTADVINTKGVLEEKMDFISKPVTPHDLLNKIREMLDRQH